MNHLSKALFSTLAKSKIGMIGCGNMGHYMAKHLMSHGNQVAAYDVEPQALKAAADIGATACKSISEASKGRDFVFTMLPRSDISTKVYTQGDDCILNAADKGTILIESSTVSPDTVINIKKQADKKGLIAIDAPVSGGQMGAINATLTFMVGCSDKSILDKVEPLFKQIGKTVFYCGDVGSGEVAKIANNMIFGVTMLAVAEAMNLADKHGMDPKLMQEIISVSSGGSFSNNVYNPYPGVIKTAPSTNNFNDGFPLSHMRKDLSLAIEAADSKEANLDTVKYAIQKYLDIEKKGHGRKDFSIIFEEIAGKLK